MLLVLFSFVRPTCMETYCEFISANVFYFPVANNYDDYMFNLYWYKIKKVQV